MSVYVRDLRLHTSNDSLRISMNQTVESCISYGREFRMVVSISLYSMAVVVRIRSMLGRRPGLEGREGFAHFIHLIHLIQQKHY